MAKEGEKPPQLTRAACAEVRLQTKFCEIMKPRSQIVYFRIEAGHVLFLLARIESNSDDCLADGKYMTISGKDYTHPYGKIMPVVDIVIVNWNGCKFLAPCLDALACQTFTDFKVWLVDNGSTDGSLELLHAQYPHVHLICNAHNRGFAAANNQGIRAGSAKYIATLNNDTLADAGWLEALVRVLDENPRAGMAASMMLFADRPEMINSAGIAIDRAGIAWDLRGGELLRPEDTSSTPIFGA
ncbi:MAG TPA: glycosyltransferase family 2 protein, partial [Anaerolineae bacterium]